jgi:hypothetical protein
MPQVTSSESKFIVQQWSASVARSLGRGYSASRVVQDLVRQGWDEPVATTFVAQVQNDVNHGMVSRQSAPKQPADQVTSAPNKHTRNIFYGALWCIGGITVTVASYQAALNYGGSRYFVTWGAIAFGLYQFLSGLSGKIRGE